MFFCVKPDYFHYLFSWVSCLYLNEFQLFQVDYLNRQNHLKCHKMCQNTRNDQENHWKEVLMWFVFICVKITFILNLIVFVISALFLMKNWNIFIVRFILYNCPSIVYFENLFDIIPNSCISTVQDTFKWSSVMFLFFFVFVFLSSTIIIYFLSA